MLSVHRVSALSVLLCVGVVCSVAVSFAQGAKEAPVEIPAGVHYKPASDAANACARDALVRAVAQPDKVGASFFDSAMTCGPGLWKVLQPSADKALLDSKPVVVIVNSVQVEARGLISEEQQRSFWKALAGQFPDLQRANIRKARADEIRYYWATIAFDIEEPFFAVDDAKQIFTMNFRMVEGKPKLFWVDLVTNLQKLTSAPKIVDLSVSTMMAEGGDVSSMLLLGRSYMSGSGVPVDLEKSHMWLVRAAEEGSFEAQMLLGAAHMSGTKFAKDNALAAKYLLLAAKNANVKADEKSSQALAEYFVAHLFEEGRGVEKSDENAVQFLKSAAEAGNSGAEFDLGMKYYNGLGGLAADKAMGCQLFVKAADQGHVRAMHNAAYCYQTGTGLTKDINTAMQYYTKAAEGGNTVSAHNLGVLYGQAGQADKTYFWLSVAKASGFDEKPELIAPAKAHLSPAQVDQEDKEVAAWLDAHKTKQRPSPPGR